MRGSREKTGLQKILEAVPRVSGLRQIQGLAPGSPDKAPRPAGASHLDQTPALPDRAQFIPSLRGHFVPRCQS